MKLEFFPLRKGRVGRPAVERVVDVDLEQELTREDAVARAKAGEPIVIKLWLRTAGSAELENLDAAIAAAVATLGVR